METGEFQGDDAPFAVVFLNAHAEGDVFRFLAGEDHGARIAGFFRRVPIGAVSGEFQGKLDLFGAGLGFLEAKEIRRVFGDEARQMFFAESRADAVDVP